MIFDLESSDAGPAAIEPGKHSSARVALRLLAIFGLITASVLFVMVCPCDMPWRTPAALVLLAFSLVACLAAAWVLYRMRQFAPNAAPLLRGVGAVGLVIAARLAELKLALACVAWLATQSR
jgi:hypothetical protein